MADDGFNVENNQVTEKKSYLLITVVLLAVIVLVVAIVIYLFFYRGNETVPVSIDSISAPVSDKIIPTDAKSPEDFLNKVNEKAAENQKKYNDSLTEFAYKKWEKFFIGQNGPDDSLLLNNLKIISQEINKDENGNTMFKIKYSIDSNGIETENEDYFYMVLSETKLKELGLVDLKPNAFLSEEDIRKNLSKEGFAKITKIQK